MSTWNSRGLRGSGLEELVNLTNDKYREKGLALIQKIPTPIKPIRIDKENRQITLAYFEQKSTVDYIGTVQGVPVCFDAKEVNLSSFPMKNIHTHQIQFMEDFEKQGGISFLLIYFTKYDRYYYLPFRILNEYYQKSLAGGRKSIRFEEFEDKYIIPCKGFHIHYLEPLSLDLETHQ